MAVGPLSAPVYCYRGWPCSPIVTGACTAVTTVLVCHALRWRYLRSATTTLPAMTSGMPLTNSKTFSRIQLAAVLFEASASLALPKLGC